MVMVPSVAIVTQTLGAKGASAAASPLTPKGSTESVSAKVSPVVPFRKSRLLCRVFMFMAQPSRAARWMALMIRR